MPTLRLTEADQQRVAAANTALLTMPDPGLPPADALTAWRRNAAGALQALIGAESAVFDLPTPTAEAMGVPRVVSDDYTSVPAAEYLVLYGPLAAPARVEERLARDGALTRTELWRPVEAAYGRSAYRNEFHLPYRMLDGLVMGVPVTGGLAQLILHRNSPTAPPVGPREAALARLVLPAFRAGLGALLAGPPAGASALDALGLALAIVGPGGRCLHQTPALTALLADVGPDACERLDGALAEAARSAVWGWEAGRSALDVPTASGTWHIRATVADERTLGPGPVALVAVEPARPAATADALRARWGLTRQEGRVACLLAARRTNAEIAAALSVSVHTARHHVERVMEKLGVSSRRDVERVME